MCVCVCVQARASGLTDPGHAVAKGPSLSSSPLLGGAPLLTASHGSIQVRYRLKKESHLKTPRFKTAVSSKSLEEILLLFTYPYVI